jgi:putative redox protein
LITNSTIYLFHSLMTTIHSIYKGNLRTESVHLRSGEKIITDAPVDNQGRGEAFSPSDLLAASLGACMMTIMGIVARNHEIDIEGMEVDVTKVMASNPRRVSAIQIDFKMPPKMYGTEEKILLERAARTCPVSLSLNPEIKQEIRFNY